MKILLLSIFISFNLFASDRYPFKEGKFLDIINKNCKGKITGSVSLTNPVQRDFILATLLKDSLSKFPPYDGEGNKLTTLKRFNILEKKDLLGFVTYSCENDYSVDFFFSKKDAKTNAFSISLRKKDDFVMRLESKGAAAKNKEKYQLKLIKLFDDLENQYNIKNEL
jgi:hypothetical protein